MVPANHSMASPNALVLLVSYASAGAEQDPGAMVVDQFGFGPRRVYVIVRLVTHGDSWGVDGVIVVPYVHVGVLRSHVPFKAHSLFLIISLECCFSACASTVDTFV